MSSYSITSLFPFRRVKIKNFFKIEKPDLGSVYFVVLTPDKRYTPICHESKSKTEVIHSWHQRKIRDLDILGNICYVVLHYRKIYCPNCGIKVEKTGVSSPGGPQVTNRLAQYIHELCQHMTVKEVAKQLNLDW
ncbi:MAG: transposase family protein [Halanaerobiales bacterium]